MILTARGVEEVKAPIAYAARAAFSPRAFESFVGDSVLANDARSFSAAPLITV